jgi:integrase
MNGSPALFVERGLLVREALVAGVSIADAAREHGVSPGTVKGWLRRGRDDPVSRYGPFAPAVDEAMAERELPPASELPADEAELRLFASRAAGAGNVQAMRLLLERGGLGHLRARPTPIRFHDLRHSYGTLGINLYNPVDVQSFMGHSDLRTTMRYLHAQPKADAAAKGSAYVAAQLRPELELVA